MGTTRAAYNDLASVYHTTIDPDGSGLRDPIFENLLGDIRGRRVLALACGQGRDARLLADLGATVVGVDVSDRLLAYAREFEQAQPRGIHYVHGDAQDLEALEDASFDGVVCHMALMDIPELANAIGAVARVLRPGGFFLASIVHPCYEPHLEVIEGYQVEGKYDKQDGPDWLPPHAYHRPLSTYVNTMAGVGLLITQLVEPLDASPAGQGVPNLLYFRCEAATA